MVSDVTSYLPYHEPGIITILIQSSFLLILNVLNSIFDSIIYCGLLAQVFVGVAFGTPGGKILGRELENVVVQLGYLGLILLVYEGGLSTNLKSLKSNLLLSSLVALTGIALPIALSFSLGPLLNATPLQCFAAGAALCATSLGTTFTILRTSGLAKSKLGVVLASAAMMDDVVGLVMVQVIANLGSASTGQFSWRTIVRPVGVSLGFAIGVPALCWAVVRPLATREWKGRMGGVSSREHTPVIVQTLFLLGMVTGAIYAGTSSLFAAYLAGAVVSWWDGLHCPSHAADRSTVDPALNVEQTETSASNQQRSSETPSSQSHPRGRLGVEVYEKYYAMAFHRVLKPFFFASIGFAIPITEMFSGQVVWRGIVYTILMVIAKLCTGLWLVRLNISIPKLGISPTFGRLLKGMRGCLGTSSQTARITRKPKKKNISHDLHVVQNESPKPPTNNTTAATPGSNSAASRPDAMQRSEARISKPLSLYPASMLGTAMTARGEIGFLIASVAASTGLFDSASRVPDAGVVQSSSEIYLVVIWAVVLCTIIGPLSVGTLVRRVKRLEGKREGVRRVDGPLGVWGLE